MRGLLALDDRSTAVCVVGPSLAIGVIDAIRRAGLLIPDDVAVVAYGDVGLAGTLRPPLTAIGTPYQEFGRRAAETLFELIAAPDERPRRVFIRTPLVVRVSRGAYRSGAEPAERRHADVPSWTMDAPGRGLKTAIRR